MPWDPREEAEKYAGITVAEILAVAGELSVGTILAQLKASILQNDLLRNELKLVCADVTKCQQEIRRLQVELQAHQLETLKRFRNLETPSTPGSAKRTSGSKPEQKLGDELNWR